MSIVSDTTTLVDGNPSVECWHLPNWPDITGAEWIWKFYMVDDESKFGPYNFTKDFSLPANAQDINASIRIDADNAYELYINNQYIGGDGTVSYPPINHSQDPDHESRWESIEKYAFNPNPGTNDLRINAVDYAGWVSPETNPAGVVYRVYLDYTICPTTTSTTTTSTTTTSIASTTSTTLPCENLWWFDNDHPYCQNKTFCGAYMYLGLKTFETKEECEGNLPTTTTTCHASTTTCPATTTTCPTTTTSTPTTTTTTIPCVDGVSITAKGQSAAGVAPLMQLWIDGNRKAQWNVIDPIRDYTYETSLGTAGHNIDIVYTNDCSVPGTSTDRNLFVYQIRSGCTTIQSTDAGVTYDKGVGSAAYDGLDAVPGQVEMYVSGALRFRINGGYNGTTTSTTTSTTSTRASTTSTTTTTTTTNPGGCTLKGDNPPCGSITVPEILALITSWAKGNATLQNVLKLITAWAAG